ncbi:hypothetical protein M409DRAFT_58045 [Zasmidium cellare ATCC 36951]|uniref:Heterokaryon incompatibility domain-containing protein n=1 Tax=Zasmidium cellare ATCC 36951 TaxID=1080233 RepID=A0A6A6C6H4_ZASCE|nr:uncharacterized protein M409DRAFT_58045 [Zasmidium cellare ATCC 36951]KAF2162625.1 hypothetical protein M409DRAFT_58045 [Zasmidium cellare ATCC 36951]
MRYQSGNRMRYDNFCVARQLDFSMPVETKPAYDVRLRALGAPSIGRGAAAFSRPRHRYRGCNCVRASRKASVTRGPCTALFPNRAQFTCVHLGLKAKERTQPYAIRHKSSLVLSVQNAVVAPCITGAQLSLRSNATRWCHHSFPTLMLTGAAEQSSSAPATAVTPINEPQANFCFSSTMDTALNTSIYSIFPLADPVKQIRLLRNITPDGAAELVYEFVICDLCDAPSFQAISYTWGDATLRNLVTINDIPMDVTWNCHLALSQARASSYTWIDSVCIDQGNLQEKSVQVAMMWDIYHSAAFVLVSFGPPDSSSEIIGSLLTELEEVILGQQLEYDFREHRQSQSKAKPNSLNAIPEKLSSGLDAEDEVFIRIHRAFNQLCGRPYFSRLWIVQELHAGQHHNRILLMFGSAPKVYFKAFQWLLLLHDELQDVWSRRLHIFKELLNAQEAADENSSTDELYESNDKPERKTRAVNTYPGIQLGVLNNLLKGHAGSHDYYSITSDTKGLDCKDVRDRVYAMRHLIDWSKSRLKTLQPDYTKSAFDIAVSLVSAPEEREGLDPFDFFCLLETLEVSAHDPSLVPFLSTNAFQVVPQRQSRRIWKLEVSFVCRLIRFDRSFAQSRLDSFSETYPNDTDDLRGPGSAIDMSGPARYMSADVDVPPEPVSMELKDVCEDLLRNDAVALAYGWVDFSEDSYQEVVVPAAAEAGDIVVCLHPGRINTGLLIRLSSISSDVAVVGKAILERRWNNRRPQKPPNSWKLAEVTFEATPEEMISFLAAPRGKGDYTCEPFAFDIPKVVGFTTHAKQDWCDRIVTEALMTPEPSDAADGDVPNDGWRECQWKDMEQ